MAGDWIKFEVTTPDKPEVVRMAAILGIDQDAVVGKLLRLWSWADQNSVDGNGAGVTSSFLDRLTFCPGFTNAMREVDWITGDDGCLTLPNFSRHNGKTAKQRAASNRRVAKHRASNADVTPGALPEALPKPLPEKRREEKKEQEQKPARKRAVSKHPIPENFALSDRVREWAREKQFDRLEKHLEHFRLTATAKGYTYADWDAALMNAITGNWAKLPAATPESQPGGGRRAL